MTAPLHCRKGDAEYGRPGALSCFAPSPFRSRPFGLQSLTRAIALRLSLWLGYRRQRIIREARAEASRRGWETRRAKAPIPFDLPADDWAPCPNCGFILVACDCDARHSPGRFGPRPDRREARPVHAMKGL